MVSFDGPNKLIILTTGSVVMSGDVLTFSVVDIYSRWKEWVMTDDNSKWSPAFRSVAGDPISTTQNISAYIFLNNTDGWRIRPDEADHEINLEGNLYAEDTTLPMFTPTLGAYTVTISMDRSSNSLTTTVSGSGIDEATVQSAMTAQGYTMSRATKLDNLDAAVSSLEGTGLTTAQAAMLLELYKLMGLDPTKPLVVTPTTRKVPEDGSEINQSITQVGNDITVQRS